MLQLQLIEFYITIFFLIVQINFLNIFSKLIK